MGKLLEAYGIAARTVLTKAPIGDDGTTGSQRGGTCGLYSLWYATVLLGIVDPGDGRGPIYPRKHMNPGGMSSRRYSKSIGSGQGEILDWYEMRRIINNFGYECDVADAAEESRRKTFITFCLEKNRPVLFAYMEGGNPGQGCHPITAYNPGYPDGCGSHWALLIDETGSDYVFIDPHWPNTLRSAAKDVILKSNAAADEGPGFKPSEDVYQRSEKAKGMVTKTYNLGNPQARQSLKNLLISVY